jgi:hypothetical protein
VVWSQEGPRRRNRDQIRPRPLRQRLQRADPRDVLQLRGVATMRHVHVGRGQATAKASPARHRTRGRAAKIRTDSRCRCGRGGQGPRYIIGTVASGRWPINVSGHDLLRRAKGGALGSRFRSIIPPLARLVRSARRSGAPAARRATGCASLPTSMSCTTADRRIESHDDFYNRRRARATSSE